MAKGQHLNTSIVLAAVHGLLGLPGRCARSSLHSFAPFPLSPSLMSNLASVDVKQNVNNNNARLVAIGVGGLYTNIPHDDIQEAFMQYLGTKTKPNATPTERIVEVFKMCIHA